MSPAVEGAVVEDCAGVVVTRGDFNCGASVAEVDGVAWCVGVGVVAVAKLTNTISSPALHGAVVEDCA